MQVPRARVVRFDGVTVLEGPKYFVQGVALSLNVQYPGQYRAEEVVL